MNKEQIQAILKEARDSAWSGPSNNDLVLLCETAIRALDRVSNLEGNSELDRAIIALNKIVERNLVTDDMRTMATDLLERKTAAIQHSLFEKLKEDYESLRDFADVFREHCHGDSDGFCLICRERLPL